MSIPSMNVNSNKWSTSAGGEGCKLKHNVFALSVDKILNN